MNERYLCVHGHFYQPPRQNPWLETIAAQDSAAPFHDWNERITAECYAPGAAARIVDGEGRILDLVNNYTSISFNVGPTLLAWLEQADPETYQRILEADRVSQMARGGHGNAIAQCYNHMIMPLATRRDKVTQVIWGIRDFEARFKRFPEGMWLPETAVDLETLEVLVEQGIRFTILSPHQARRVRLPGQRGWMDVSHGRIDPSRPYRCLLPSGREIALFFYDGPIARAIAFEGVLAQGEGLIARLMAGFHAARTHVQLLHVATDGETYGHHHRFGEMALAYALRAIAERKLATLTNYGQYLARFPPDHLVEIEENTSWSCAHGIERWRSDCGCQTGGKPGWHQRWRKPLRDALDWLRDRLQPVFVDEGSKLFKDPWAARDAYIEVMLDRSRACVERFFGQHASRKLSDAEIVHALKLLEIQQHAQLMYTSCAWFFAEIAGIETVQTLTYAARAIQLTKEVSGQALEEGFLTRLARAPSNQPHLTENGREVYRKLVKIREVTPRAALAQYAMSFLVESEEPRASLRAYAFHAHASHLQKQEPLTLALGCVHMHSRVTWEQLSALYAVLHWGGHDLRCWIQGNGDPQAYERLRRELFNLVRDRSLIDVTRTLDLAFGSDSLDLTDLFLDGQQAIGRMLLAATLQQQARGFRELYTANRRFMHFLQQTHLPIPAPLRVAVDVTLHGDLTQAARQFTEHAISLEALLDRIHPLQQDAKRVEYSLDLDPVRQAMETRMQHHIMTLSQGKEQAQSMPQLLEAAKRLQLKLNLWRVQNFFWEALADRSLSVPRSLLVELGTHLGFARAAVEKRVHAPAAAPAKPSVSEPQET